jgi:hypothetical protein
MTDHPDWPVLWLPELEALSRGISHSVSNRVGALSALVELGDDESAEGRAGIRAELRRLHEVNTQLKQLVSAPRGEAEALTLAELCREAAGLHSLRLDLREIPCEVVATQDVAVRANRVLLLQLLLVVLARSARRAPAALRMTVTGTDTEARVHVSGVEGVPSGDATRELGAATDALGAELTEGGAEVVLVMPSLQEIRRRERAGEALTPPRRPAP